MIKVIGGGLPVGAFGGRADIMDYLAPNGPVYQAGTLSGNPLAMAAGLAQLRELDKVDGWKALENTGARLETGIRSLLAQKGLDFTFHRTGSMFCLFFTENKIVNLDSVSGADMEAFKRFFWSLLDQGIYFAPSPYETGFISLTHSTGDIDETLECVENALKKV